MCITNVITAAAALNTTPPAINGHIGTLLSFVSSFGCLSFLPSVSAEETGSDVALSDETEEESAEESAEDVFDTLLLGDTGGLEVLPDEGFVCPLPSV